MLKRRFICGESLRMLSERNFRSENSNKRLQYPMVCRKDHTQFGNEQIFHVLFMICDVLNFILMTKTKHWFMSLRFMLPEN